MKRISMQRAMLFGMLVAAAAGAGAAGRGSR